MGRGDMKTIKGKRTRKTYGKKRPKGTKSASEAAAVNAKQA